MDDSNKTEYGRVWENVRFLQGKGPACDDNSNKKAEHIVRFLRNQLQLKNISFLLGSGTSSPALPLMSGLYKVVEEKISNNHDSLQSGLFDKVSAKAQGNLEEILGLLYSRLSYYLGIERNEDEDNECNTAKGLIEQIEKYILTQLNQNISDKSSKGEGDFAKTLKVYETFYRALAPRSKELSRLSVFTTNNDLFNETAMDNTNTMYINGFTPGIKRYFNPSLFHHTYSKRMDPSIDKYEPLDNMVYLYKLHGSVNWVEQECVGNKFYNIVEIDAAQSISSAQSERVMIYPAPTKQNKSLGSPYTDIIRAFHHKLLLPNSVLFVCGYSFSDEHLNRIIYQALAANSSLNVVVVNKIDDKKEIRQVQDRRIYHLWEAEPNPEGHSSATNGGANPSKGGQTDSRETNVPIHYFSEFVKLLSEIISQQDDSQELLNKFSNEIFKCKDQGTK